MDWYPLYNSLRVAAIACVAVFFTGIFAAYYVAKLPRLVKGLLDVVLTLPMVLPPTVVGYFLLLLFRCQTAIWHFPCPVWHQGAHDLVVGGVCSGGGVVPADVPHGTRRV